jgi:hypothetical protein
MIKNLSKDSYFTPKGQPLPLNILLLQVQITEQDLERAIATSHPSLKPYLNAQPYRFANLR